MNKQKRHPYSSVLIILVVCTLLLSLGIQFPLFPKSDEVAPPTTEAPSIEPSQPRAEPQIAQPPSKPIPAQVVVRFTPNTTQQERAAYVESIGGTVVQNIDSLDTVVLTVPEEIAQEPLPESPVVEQSEPDYFVTALGDVYPVNDPRYLEQWALPAIGAAEAWAQLPTDAVKVTVAVIDSGICASHPDLRGRIVDGWDFLESDAVPQDDFGHGCSVSGVIAANMNDGIGIAGVAPNAQIMPLRVLNASGMGSYSDVAAAIVYATDHGAQVINLSLGGSNPSSILEDAVNYAISKGVIVVAAAGNNGTEGALYPAAYPDVIAVGSVDSNLQHSSFSNYGSQIDIWAPGQDILTTKRDGSYGLVSGTSFAAPYVAGAEAVSIVLSHMLTLDGNTLSFGAQMVGTATPIVVDIPTEGLLPTPTGIEPTSPASDETPSVEWKNYEDFDLGFSVRYPSHWLIGKDKSHAPTFPGSLVTFKSAEKTFDVTIIAFKNQEALDIDKLATFLVNLSYGKVDDYSISQKSVLGHDARSIAFSQPLIESSKLEVLSTLVLNGEWGYWMITQYERADEHLSDLSSARINIYNEMVSSLSFLSPERMKAAMLPNYAEFEAFKNAPENPTGSLSTFVWPSTGYIGYIYNRNGHNGIDIWTNTSGTGNNGSKGNPIYPPYAGKVTAVYTDPRGAQQGLRVEHTSLGLWTHYFHMADEVSGASYIVSGLLWQNVDTSTLLGYQGDRIWNPGDQITHLHFTVANGSADANSIDPSPYFDTSLNWNNPNHIGWLYYVEHGGSSGGGGTGKGCDQVTYNGVELYEHANCNRDSSGKTKSFSSATGWTDIVSDFNDISSSIYVKPGWSVKVFEKSVGEGGGSWRCITGSMWDLNIDYYTNGDTNRKINDDISSVQVYSNSSSCGVSSSNWAFQIFDLGDYNGEKYESTQSINDLSSVGKNDWAESIKINSGYEIVACEHANYGGVCGRATGPREFSDLNALAQGLRGQLTSVRVCAGSCPSGPSQPSSPNPSDWSTLSRTNNTTLYWSTNGDSCQVFVQGGSININPTGSCSSLFLGQQRGGAYSWYVKSTNSYGTTQGSTWHFNIKPYGPANLGASVASANQINLSWSLSGDDNGTDVDGYDIYRNGQLLTSVNKGVSSYPATGLTCNTGYSFYVVSKRQGVQSDASNTVSATTSTCGPGTPSLNTPANNTVVGRYDSVTVSWNTASGATQYYAEFWGDSGLSINSGWTSSTSFFVGSTFWGGTYQWRVKSRNSSNVESGWSETRTLLRKYGSPSNFTATAASASQINLGWSASADAPGNIEGYRIYRGGTPIATVGSSTTTYSDSGVSCNTSYSYYVKAYKASLESDASTTASVTLTGCPPSMPGNLAVSGATSYSLTLTWTDTSSNETGFRIYRWKYDGTQWAFVEHATVGAGTTTYTETGLPCGNDFNFYEVSAYNANGESPHAGWVKGITSSCPLAPNDDFDSPKVISQLPYTDTLETTGATSATDDPPLTTCRREPGIGTVWYRYVPPRDGQIDVDTIGSDYDTMLGVWTGTRGNLTLIGCNDDGYGLQSQLTIDVTGGVTYYIGAMQFSSMISLGLEGQSLSKPTAPAFEIPGGGTALGHQGGNSSLVSALSGGMLQLHMQFKQADLIVTGLSFSSANPPANQPFNVIIDVKNQGRFVAEDFWVAIYVDRQPSGCNDLADWYGHVSSLAPGATQSVTILLVGDLIDGLPQGSHQIRAQADIDCRVYENDENNNGYGPVSINVAASLTPPSNDDFGLPKTITANPYSETLDTRGATRAQDDPVLEACGLNPGKGSVWYRFTPAQDGTLYVDTAGSDYDTVLAVWTGSRGNLTHIACNDDIGNVNGFWDQDSRLNTPLAEGTTYYIEVITFGDELSGAGLQNTRATAQSDKGKPTDELSALSGGAMKLNFRFAPVVSAGLYDDAHVAWTFTGDWTAYTGTGPSGNTMYYASSVDSEAKFSFDGEKFTLTYLKANNRGLIDVYVDGTKIAQINAYSSTLAWKQTWTSPAFTPGVHTVRFVHAGGGTYIDIDAIQIFAPPPTVGIGTYDDNDPAWKFSSGWTVYTGTGPYNNTNHYTNVLGSETQISFNGTRFKLTYVKASNRGLIDVYVDGTKISQINAKSTTTAWQQTWTSPPLTSGVHTIRFVHAGASGTYVDVDAIQILGASDTVPPAAIVDLYGEVGTTTGTVDLSWTAPGDDGSTGTATNYLVRYSTTEINDDMTWNAATPVGAGISTPAAAGTTQTLTVSGLTPGASYFFAVRAVDEEGNLGGLSNASSAVAQSPTAVPAGNYDDTDINWTYLGAWTTYNGGGPANNTSHYSGTVGSEAQFTFEGAKFKITYVKASNRGLIDVYVDGTKVGQINAKSTTTTWQQVWTSPDLIPGIHTVRFVHAGGGTYIDVDKIQILEAAVVPSSGTYDDAEAGWTFSSGWTAHTGTGPVNNTDHYTNVVGGEAQFTFTGTGFTFTYVKASNRGLIDVYVDGVKVTQINARSTSTLWQQTWTYSSLTSGTHTVRFVNAGGGYIDIDVITILP